MSGGILVELYDTDGLTRVAVLDQARDVSWMDVLSRPGSCSFAMPADDPKRPQLVDNRIVRFTYNGMAFGHRLSPEQTWVHTDNRGMVTYSGLGLGALLADYVLWPEYPIDRYTDPVRGFGPYSKTGAWFTGDALWDPAPFVLRWRDDTGRREGKPRFFGKFAPGAYWISPFGIYTDVPDGTVWWVRQGGLDVDVDSDVMVVWTADNYCDLWVDGRKVGENDGQLYGWRKAKRYKCRWEAGLNHVIAARVENAKTTTGGNPTAFICAVVTLDNKGNPDKVIARSNNTWDVHVSDPEPGWYRGQILHRVHDNATDRGVRGALALGMSFSETADTSSNAWTGERIIFERPIDTPGDEVAMALAEEQLDWHANAATMELDVFNRAGQNRATGSSAIRLMLPQGLTGYQTTRRRVRKTALLAQRADGRWVERTSGVGAAGRMEVGATVSAAGSEGTIRQLVDVMLRRTAAAQVEHLVSGSALVGPQPGIDYNPLGDSILVPAHVGQGHHKVRSLGYAVNQDGDSVRCWPLFTVDGT